MIANSEKRLRVAAYCRVSTDREDQASSLESQKRYFREYIERNPGWELYEIFADEGLSGTNTKKRRGFNRMIAAAERRDFELVITKEISRFARNTLDSILYTRRLKELGIGVIFINDNINTLDSDAELRLTIMSSIAQEESRKTSERVKWGQKRRMEQGVVFGRDMLGYDLKNGRLILNEQGAQTVRLIFHKYVNERKGARTIARELTQYGAKTSPHMKRWSDMAVLRILKNEKYCGDLIQKKTFTPDYLSHQKKPNKGQEELVILRDHHQPIVDRELFEQAQAELARRSPKPEQRVKYSNRYCFSGRIKCGECGSSFVSRTKKRADESVCKAWRCYRNVRGPSARREDGKSTGCRSPSLNDEAAKQMLLEVIKNQRPDILRAAEAVGEAILRALSHDSGEDSISGPQARLEALADKKLRLLELFVSGDISKQEYKLLGERFAAEISALNAETEAILERRLTARDNGELIARISAELDDISRGRKWDDTFCRQMVDRITVNGDGTAELRLMHHPARWVFARK